MGQCDKADDRVTAQEELIRVYEGTLAEIAGGSSRTARIAFALLIPYLDSARALVGKDPSKPEFITSAINGLCSVAMGVPGGPSGFCTPVNTGYASFTDCVNYLSSIPGGI